MRLTLKNFHVVPASETQCTLYFVSLCTNAVRDFNLPVMPHNLFVCFFSAVWTPWCVYSKNSG